MNTLSQGEILTRFLLAKKTMATMDVDAAEGINAVSSDHPGAHQIGVSFVNPITGSRYGSSVSLFDPTPERIERAWDKLFKIIENTLAFGDRYAA